MPQPTAVYRLYDASDELLYVGISSQPESRLRQHGIDKRWWSDVARKTVAWCETREDARAEEARAIIAESPRYNKAKPPRDTSVMMIRMPPEVHERLRHLAFDRRVSINSIVEGFLSERIAELEAAG